MIVFKNYFRIVKQHKVSILMYSVIFFFLMFVFANTGSVETNYISEKPDVYIVDESQSTLSLALIDYLDEHVNRVELNPKNAEDELFYGFVSANITLEKDFQETKEVFIKNAPQNMSSILIRQNVNEFLNKVNVYQQQDKTLDEAIDLANSDLTKKSEISLNTQEVSALNSGSVMYFNFLNYVLMAQILLIITTVMSSFNKDQISQRNTVSPLTRKSMVLQITLGHIVMGGLVWLVYTLFFIVVFGSQVQLPEVQGMILNSFVFTISVITMAIFISRYIVNENSLSAILNVVTLGSSFLAGAFVPQELLSDFTLNLSKILPSYYYITNNNMLAQNGDFNTILFNLAMMLGFSVLFSILTMSKKRT